MREELKAERAQRPPGAERWWGQPQAPVHPWTRSGPPRPHCSISWLQRRSGSGLEEQIAVIQIMVLHPLGSGFDR